MTTKAQPSRSFSYLQTVTIQVKIDVCQNEEEKVLSSTHRELLANDFSLGSFCVLLGNSKVKWFTDNQSTAKIVQVGSM